MSDIRDWKGATRDLSTMAGQLRKAQAEGKWGFMTSYGGVTGTSLLTTQVESWAAQAWTINLYAFRFQGGQSSAGGPPPENQTARLIQARVQFGNDAGYEEVEVDYPSRGCTFAVHGALVRVYIDPPDNEISSGITPTPLLGGHLSPSNVSGDYTSPKFTFSIPSIGALAAQNVPIPRRATSYSIAYVTDGIAPAPIRVSQVAGQAGLSSQSWDIGSVVAGAASDEFLALGNPQSIGNWRQQTPIPIRSSAGALRITNAGAVATALVVEFNLDLG